MARLFLIDGDSRYRRLLRAALEGAQHEVVEFEPGAQALHSFSAKRPDVPRTAADLIQTVRGERYRLNASPKQAGPRP